MSDTKEKNEAGGDKVKSLVDSLISQIESISKLSGNKLDLKAIKDNMVMRSADQMRKEETQKANLELRERNRRLREEFIEKTRKTGHIDPNWTFDNMIVDPANERAVTDARLFCHARMVSPEPPSIFILAGGPGSGKSVLANAMANCWLIDSNKEGSYHDVCVISATHFERIRYFNQSEDREDLKRRRDEWERFCNASMIIIDGLCENGQGLSVFMQKVLAEFLRIRFEKRLSVILTVCIPAINYLPQAMGPQVMESCRQYDNVLALLMGRSRRKPIMFNGCPLE